MRQESPGTKATSTLQIYEMYFYCLSHWVCGVLLWQPEQTNVVIQPATKSYQLFAILRFFFIISTVSLRSTCAQMNATLPYLLWLCTSSLIPIHNPYLPTAPPIISNIWNVWIWHLIFSSRINSWLPLSRTSWTHLSGASSLDSPGVCIILPFMHMFH